MALYQPLRVGNNPTAQTVLGSDPLPNTLPDEGLDDKQDQREYSDDELLDEARKFLNYVETQENDNRNRAAEMLRFCYKRKSQWPDKMRTDRENENRPVLEINQMPAFLNNVLNDIRQNRPAIKVRGASDDATAEMAEIRQDLIRHIEYDSNAEVVYDNGVRYAAAGNVGYWRIVTEYESDTSFNQKLLLKTIPNPFSVYYDPDCVEPDGSDCKRCLVSEEIKKEEFRRRYPNAQYTDWQTDDPVLTAWLKEDTIRIADYFHIVKHVDTLCQYEDGTVMWESEGDGKDHGKKVQERTVDREEVRWEVINGIEILERHQWAGSGIPVIPVFGDVTNIEGETIRQGLVDRAVDQQQMYNFLVTNAAEAASLQTKSPWLVAEGQIEQREAMWGQANIKQFPYLVYRATDETGKPLPPPQRVSPDVDVSGMLEQATRFQQDMRLAIGIADPLAQMQVQDESGRAILAKERVGATQTFHFVDNLSRAIRLTGKRLLDLIPHIYDTQRTLQLLKEDGTQYKAIINQQQPQPVPDPNSPNVIPMPQALPLLNDMSVGDYDIVVDVGPSYASKRVEFVNSVMELTQSNPALWQVAGDLMVKNMDWPNAEKIAERLKAMLPAPIQQMEAQESKDPEVIQMGIAMQQQAQQFQEQSGEMVKKISELTQQNQSLQSQVYVGKAAHAKLTVDMAKRELDYQQKDQQAQADVITQMMESRDVQAKIAQEDRKAHAEQFKILQEGMAKREEVQIEQARLGIEAFQAITDAMAKLGAQQGELAARMAEAETPKAVGAAEKAPEPPDMKPIADSLDRFGQMLLPLHQGIAQMIQHTGTTHALLEQRSQQPAEAPKKPSKRRYTLRRGKEPGTFEGEAVDDEGGQ